MNIEETYRKGKKILFKPNSKQHFEREGANLQVISLATDLPKVELTLKDQLEYFFNKNWFLPIYQELEKELYINGMYALGLEKTNDPNAPKIKIAKILDYQIENFELVKLKIVVDKKQENRLNVELIEEYDLTKDSIYLKAYAKNSKGEFKPSDYFPDYKEKLNTFDFIPYVIFFNRWDKKSDIEALVNPEHFELLDSLYTQLTMEGYFSNPLYKINANSGGNEKYREVVKALFSDDERVIKTSSLSGFSLQKDFEQIPGISLSQQILQKIENVKYWIKDALFLKKSSQDGGTKNMHSLEAQQLNSNFEDYIETKANLREYLFKQFIELYLRFAFQITDYTENDIKVTVTGSTNWLKEQATQMRTNQSGVLLNSNQVYSQAPNNQEVENND